MWDIASVLWMDSISTAEAVQYCGDSISTVEGEHQYMWRDSINAVGDTINTAEAIQYCGG